MSNNAELVPAPQPAAVIEVPAPGELIAFPTGRWAIPQEDMADFGLLGEEEQERVKFLLTLFAKMEAGGIIPMSETLGFQLRNARGYGASNLRAFYYRWRDGGWRAIVRKFTNGGEKLPTDFVQHFKALCENNGRSMLQARAALIRAWMRGDAIPGYGTWREWYFSQWPTREIPDVCPCTPKGWGKSNLYTLQPTKAQRAAKTRGLAEMKLHLPSLIRDPGALRPLELIVIDDFEIDQVCFYFDPATGIRSLCRMAGIAAMDVATRRIIGLILKPRLEDEKGKKQSITRAEVRLLLYQVLKDHGIPAHGMTIMAENAAAAVTTEVELTFRNLFGGLVAVTRTGVLDSAVLAAGFKDSGGKPWLKGWIESFFNLMHNVAASMTRGQKGASYQLAPGNLEQMQRLTERLIGTGDRDARLSDAQLAKARVPFQSVDELIAIYQEVFRIIENRDDHQMLGFRDITMWRQTRAESYRPWEELAQLTEDEQCAITDFHRRKQTPRERWDELYPRIERAAVEDYVLMMLLLTPKKGKINGHKITFAHHGKGYTWLVSPRSELAATMRDGAEVLCYFDAADARIAHVARLDGRYLGEVKRFGPVDITNADQVNEAEKVLAQLYAEVLATVRERPLHQAENARLVEDKAINDGLVAEAEAQRNRQGVTATLGRAVPATTDGNATTATGADLAGRVVAANAERKAIDKIDTTKLLARRAKAAGKNEETQPASNQDASWV
ncbi:MAG: hypothetical protein WC700_19345 [Gemmatimonadaceae bacterium]|jgi:hypothetical protein